MSRVASAVTLAALLMVAGCGVKSAPAPATPPTVESAPQLDVNDPGSVMRYWREFKSKSVGNEMVDDPDERKRYDARVVGKQVRWPATVRLVEADGTVHALSAGGWPFKDEAEWAGQAGEPRPGYLLSATVAVKAADLNWAKTLKRGDVVTVTGTVREIKEVGNGRAKTFGGGKQASFWFFEAALEGTTISP